jgi:hypothetical protein
MPANVELGAKRRRAANAAAENAVVLISRERSRSGQGKVGPYLVSRSRLAKIRQAPSVLFGTETKTEGRGGYDAVSADLLRPGSGTEWNEIANRRLPAGTRWRARANRRPERSKQAVQRQVDRLKADDKHNPTAGSGPVSRQRNHHEMVRKERAHCPYAGRVSFSL